MKTSVLESLFNKAAGLAVCNSIKKRLQHSYFPVKLAKFLKIPFLQRSFRGCFLRLPCFSERVRRKNRCDCQQQILDSVDKITCCRENPESATVCVLQKKAFNSQHKCFPVNIANFLRTSILKDIWERLLLKIRT